VTEQLEVTGKVESFDEEKREIQALIVPWDVEASQASGVHVFKRGSFDGIDPSRIVLRQRHQDPPTGRAFELRDEEDGLRGWFRISKTAAGDEQLTLLKDGVETGVSVAFDSSKHTKTQLLNGRTRYTHTGFQDSRSLEVSTTWMPAFPQARVLEIMEATVAEAEAPVPAEASPAADGITTEMLRSFEASVQERFDALQDRIAAQNLVMPDSLKRESEAFQSRIGLGADLMRTEGVREAFLIDDGISSDNLGVIPEMRSSNVIGIINNSRPFLESTTREPVPPAGETWKFPKITQRPEVGLQSTEKSEVASQKTIITSVDFPMATYAGAGDLSIQLIKRSSPEYLRLYEQLLGEDYAIKTDNAAVDDLLSETAVVEGTGGFDPASPSFGEAFANAAAAALNRPGLLPNRIWLSTAALVAFIDAKSPTGGGGTPLYPGLAGITGMTNGGPGGPAGFNMTPVWVPALDDEAVDLIIGPSQGFHWTEDGTYLLTADVPDKAGKDVGLVGMIWFAPIYPAAFTTYALAS
jgi:HK97 family phage prohead protease